MRLTLRTLLAWMDDTLPPAEVRDIGQQVAESPFATELVERIHTVTRRRRLTVPKGSGDEATDPNLVAAYLDNTLGPDEVTEYEKLCLTSDVHLAEVASAHQILSLIGQKAKVPPEARARMYKLAQAAAAPAAAAPRARPRPVAEEAAEVSSTWERDLIRRPWTEQYGPALLVVGLFLMLGVGTWKSLNPRRGPAPPIQIVRAETEGEPRRPVPLPQKPIEPASKPAEPPRPVPAAAPVAPKEDVTDEPKEAERPARTPAQGIGTVGKTDGVLLRYNTNDQHWERAAALSPLKPDDRIVSLAPFRIPLQVGTAKVEMVREAEIRPRLAESGLAGQFEVVRGRVVAHIEEPDRPIGVNFGGRLVKIAGAVDTAIGLERADHHQAGDAEATPILRIYVPEGKVTLAAGTAQETLTGPASLQFRPPGTFQEKGHEPPPAWVVESGLSPADKRFGAEFATLFATQEFPKTVLVQATLKDQEKEIRQLALAGLGLIGEIRFVFEALNTPDDPTSRRAAIGVLRSALAQSPETAREVRDAIQEVYPDPNRAQAVEKLLAGYSAREARDDKTYDALVKDLEAPDVGIRELALDNLRSLTARDPMDYNPDKPDEGPGLRAWQDLQKAKKPRPAPADREK